MTKQDKLQASDGSKDVTSEHRLHRQRLIIMNETLYGDCVGHYKSIKQTKKKSPRHRRAYVRSVFAMIEGLIYSLKQLLVHDVKFLGRLSEDELEALKEVAIEITDAGKIKKRSTHTSFIGNVKFTLNTFCKHTKTDLFVDYNNVGWQCLKDGVVFRNRLSHPKETNDLEVSDKEIEICRVASEWFIHNITIISWSSPTFKIDAAARDAVITKHSEALQNLHL